MYWVIRRTSVGSAAITEFGMDTDADLADLPTSATEGLDQGDGVSHLIVDNGSTAFSVASSKTFMLNSSNVWTEIAVSGSGSSSSVPVNIYYPKFFELVSGSYEWVTPASTDYSGNNDVPVYRDANGDSHFPVAYSDTEATYVIVDDNGGFTTMVFAFSTSTSSITLTSSSALSEDLFVIE